MDITSNKTTEVKKICVITFIYICALIIRLARLCYDPIIPRDSIIYLDLAQKWNETGNYEVTLLNGVIIPPLPIYTIKTLLNFSFSKTVAGSCISIFLGSLIPVLVYYISQKILKNIIISLFNTCFTVIHPTLISYSIYPLREIYYLFFLCIIILSAINLSKKKRIVDSIFCGLSTAFAFFSRYEALEFVLVIPAMSLYYCYRKHFSPQKCILSIMFYLLSFILGVRILCLITSFNASFITKIETYKNIFLNDVISNFDSENSSCIK